MGWYQFSRHFKSIFFVAAVLIILVLLVYTQQLVDQLRDEARHILEFYARMYARAASSENTADVGFIFDEIIKRTNFPLIYTDSAHNPHYWKGINVPPEDRSEEALRQVRKIMQRMQRIASPIPITYHEITLGYLYYGDSATITQLRWLPYIEIGVISLFIFVGFVGFSNIKKSEQRYLWVGMAKETAHQLGTPLSSIDGWLELLQEKSSRRVELQKILAEMKHDLARLHKVAARFSQIGSTADLKNQDVNAVIREVVAYFRRRLPQMGGKKIEIMQNYGEIPAVPLNAELFGWVLENLIKNSLDAIDKESGVIEIRTGAMRHRRYSVFIDIRDTGKGIVYRNKNDIFKPGYSTKKRGWGLGLNLAKRIIEEYHRGKLMVKETKPGEGTTMRVVL